MQKWAKYRSSFPPLTFKPLHLDLLFDVRDDVVKVTQRSQGRRRGLSCACGVSERSQRDIPSRPVEKLTVKTGKITIELKTPVPAGEEFVLRTENLVKPTANILEGEASS
eukprot:122372-Amorphochlora_amoeboformis.AAC.1